MGKVFIGMFCIILTSCCFFLYSSTPPIQTSSEWEKFLKNKEHDKIEFILVAPGQEDERVQSFIRKIVDALAHSETFFCRHCVSLSNYSFAYEKADVNDFVKVDVIQPQYGVCIEKKQNLCEYVYRDMYDVDISDSAWQQGVEKYNWRNTHVNYYVPRENKKKNALYLVFSISFDVLSENRYAIWDSERKTFFVKGMLNSFSLDDGLDEIAQRSADILAINLGLR